MRIETYIFKQNYTGLLEGGITKEIVDWELEEIKKICKVLNEGIEPYFHYGDLDINTMPILKYTHIAYLVSSKCIDDNEFYCGSHSIFVFFSNSPEFSKKDEIIESVEKIGWNKIAENFDY